MYNATPRSALAWRALFDRVHADVGLQIEIIEHKWPQPIDELWSREGLCGAFMCGWPFVRSAGSMQAVAAPVPALARYAGKPRYCSEFLVREESGWTTLEETFGHRFGWMAANSQSGFNAPRAHLARWIGPGRSSLYSAVTGPLGSPAQALSALADRRIDVIALDSFYLDLLRQHDPARLAGVRCVATTQWTPIPLLVAAPAVPGPIVQRLRARLLELHQRPSCAPLLAEAGVSRFVAADVESYGVLDAMAGEAMRRGYDVIR
jgi:ABC-type phosphate/phosphonate transport system substrate-binding protein